MNKKITNCRNIIIVLFFAVLIFSPYLASAALEISYPEIPGAETPQIFMQKIKDGLIDPSQAMPLYVLYFYILTVIVSGILAFGSVVYGVIRYLVSGGAVSQMIAAKEQIADAIIGLLIILSSYVIMTTIDPKMLIFISKPPTVCLPVGDPHYDPLDCQPINYPGGYTVLMDYIEVPLGRLVESVIQKGWAAENAAYAVQMAAERLAALTKRLTTITNPPAGTTGCRCSDFSSSCSGATCSGGCRQSDPCYHVRAELDCLLYKTCVCPPVSSMDSTDSYSQSPSVLASLVEEKYFDQTLAAPMSPGCSTPDNCLTADVINISVSGSGPGTGTVTYSPDICQTCGEVTGHIGDVQIGKIDGTFGGTIQIPPLPSCYTYSYDAWTPPVEIACPGTASVGYYYDARKDLNPACFGRHTVSCNVTVDKSCKVTKTTCGGTPVCTCSCGLIQDAINALKAARCQASRAQIDLAKELLKLKLAEALLRDSQASPITYETFIAFEGENADIHKLSIWDNIKLDEDPYDDPEDPYIGEPDGTDPATFYVPVEGNEYIIELSRNAFFQFQPANGCEGLSGGGGQPPAPCTASVISPFPAFYQYGPGGIVNPWQNTVIDSCSPTAIITNWGCGPTSLAMVVKYLTGQDVNPKIIADQLNTSDPSEWVCGVGTISGGINRIAGDYGLNHVDININQISGHIAKNHPVIAYCKTIFGDPHAGHITVIKGDNCSQVLFQDTVDGERWEDKTTVQSGVAQGGYDCYAFSAFCKSSEGADCGVVAPPPPPPPPPPPADDPITTFTEKCITKTNREGNEGLNPKYWTFSLVDEPKTIVSKPAGTIWPDLDPTGAFSPQLVGLLGRIPSIMKTYAKSSPTRWEQKWPVHQIGLATSPGESVKLPDADFPFSITSMCCGYEAIVIYADSDSMTFNYDNFDGVSTATIYLTGISVNPKILDIYNNQTLKGCTTGYYGDRVPFAALKPGALLGTAIGSELKVSTRGGSTWFDPRWQQLYWHGY